MEQIKSGKKLFLAIDLGGTLTKIAIINSGFKILKKKIFLTDICKAKTSKIFIDNLAKEVEQILNTSKLQQQIKAFGIGVPGLVDFSKGIVHSLTNITNFQNVPLRKILQSRFGMQVFIDNDVNLMALAEAKIGAAAGYKNAVCLTLGTGVGGGIICEGKLYRGASFSAGEIGHIPLNLNGPICNCGGYGCLERYIGNRIILRKAKIILRKKDLTMEQLSSLAREGNELALNIFKDYAKKLGTVLAGIVNFFNPEVIVIGGGIANAGRFLFSQIHQTIKERALSVSYKALNIKKAKLGSDAGLIGAAILIQENFSR